MSVLCAIQKTCSSKELTNSDSHVVWYDVQPTKLSLAMLVWNHGYA